MIDVVLPAMAAWLASSEASLSAVLPTVPVPPGVDPLGSTVEIYEETSTEWLALRQVPPAIAQDGPAVLLMQAADLEFSLVGQRASGVGMVHQGLLEVEVAVVVRNVDGAAAKVQAARVVRGVLDSLASFFGPAGASARRQQAVTIDAPTRTAMLAGAAYLGDVPVLGGLSVTIPVTAVANVLST